MKIKTIIASILLLTTVALAQDRLGQQSIIWQDVTQHLSIVNQNKDRLSRNWTFVVDSSHSTWNIAGRVLSAFKAVTTFPEDELRFSLYTFNLRGIQAYRDWAEASPEEFSGARAFIRQHRGVNSYVGGALHDALHQIQDDLTIIVISDGGFSERFDDVQQIIRDGQEWRREQGLKIAIICGVGIENMLSRESRPPYPKDTNIVCQRRMQAIGRQNHGGFFYLQPRNSSVLISAMLPGEQR